VLTEMAAIALRLADRYPLLAPQSGTTAHRRFWRLPVWIIAHGPPLRATAEQMRRDPPAGRGRGA